MGRLTKRRKKKEWEITGPDKMIGVGVGLIMVAGVMYAQEHGMIHLPEGPVGTFLTFIIIFTMLLLPAGVTITISKL